MKFGSYGIVLALLLGGVGFGLPLCQAIELAVAPGSGQVSFEAVGNPSALKVHGSTASLSGKLTSGPKGLTGKLEVAIDSLDTGIKMRNEHMTKRYLEVEKFPKSELTIESVGDLKEGSALSVGTLPFEGQFTLHGVTRPVKGEVKLAAPGTSAVAFEATFEVSLKDYAIKTPSFAGITIADQVKVNVKASATIPGGKASL